MGRRRPLLGLFSALTQDRRGVAALEFAMVAPVMIVMFFGMAEVGQGLIAARRVSHATSALGDLVAQDDNLHDSEAADAFAAASDIMAPLPTDTLKLRITSVTGVVPGKGLLPALKALILPGCTAVPEVDWSDGYNGFTAYTKGSPPPVTMPTGLICSGGDTVILSESSYNYTSPVGYVLPDGLAFQRIAYLRPRQGAVKRTSP